MPCPTCDHTMQNIGVEHERIFWCSRCGTLKNERNPEYYDVDVPSWVKRFCVSINDIPRMSDSLELDREFADLKLKYSIQMRS